MNKALFYHSYSRANSFFQNTEYAARDYPDADELALLTPLKKEIPAEVFTQIYRPPVSSGDGFERANLLKADAILNQAGWIVKNQRRVNAKSGKPLRFELLLPSGSSDPLGPALPAQPPAARHRHGYSPGRQLPVQ